MILVKCPRCELNYMKSTEQMCKVCYREMHGKLPVEEAETCSTCNEAQALPGRGPRFVTVAFGAFACALLLGALLMRGLLPLTLRVLVV